MDEVLRFYRYVVMQVWMCVRSHMDEQAGRVQIGGRLKVTDNCGSSSSIAVSDVARALLEQSAMHKFDNKERRKGDLVTL